MRVLCTYHPAAILHAGKRGAGEKGPSRETILRCIQEDFKRASGITSNDLSLPSVGIPLVGTVLGVDCEYSGKGNTVLHTVAISDDRTSYSRDRTLNASEGGASAFTDVKAPLSTARVLVGHNLTEDIRLLWEEGLIPKREEWVTGEGLLDSLLIARMAYEDHPSYKLEDLLAEFYTVKGWKQATRGSKDSSTWAPADRAERCRLDAWAAVKIVEHEWGKL